jgi:hypothetical protein
MKKQWSIRIEIVGAGGQGNNWVVFSTDTPYECSPEEAQAKLDTLRDKIAAIARTGLDDRCDPLIAYEREMGGEMQQQFNYWVRNEEHVQKAISQRYFKAVVDECVIPASVLRRCITRLSLVMEI